MHIVALACSQGRRFLFLNHLSFLTGSFEGRATIDGATVILQRVTQEDAGEYRCEISASLDSISLGETNVTLKVLGTTGRKSVRRKIHFKCAGDWLVCAYVSVMS